MKIAKQISMKEQRKQAVNIYMDRETIKKQYNEGFTNYVGNDV